MDSQLVSTAPGACSAGSVRAQPEARSRAPGPDRKKALSSCAVSFDLIPSLPKGRTPSASEGSMQGEQGFLLTVFVGESSGAPQGGETWENIWTDKSFLLPFEACGCQGHRQQSWKTLCTDKMLCNPAGFHPSATPLCPNGGAHRGAGQEMRIPSIQDPPLLYLAQRWGADPRERKHKSLRDARDNGWRC